MIMGHDDIVSRMSLRTDIALRLVRGSFDKRFRYARLTRIPVVGKAMGHVFFGGDNMIVLPKEDVFIHKASRTIDLNIPVLPENIVLPSHVIDHFIDRSEYIFLMDKCICRDSNHCHHYPTDIGCIFLGRGANRMPRDRGRLVGKEEAKEHMRKGREVGLVNLIGRDKIDSVVFATGHSSELLSICSCCPCCCLWKMVPDLSPAISNTLTRMPGLEVQVVEGRCIGCGLCIERSICYVQAMSLIDGKIRIDDALCKGCARCVEFCRQDAIRLEIKDPRFIEESIKRIESLVDTTGR